MNWLLTATLVLLPSISVAQEADAPTDEELFLDFGKKVAASINRLEPGILDSAFDMKVMGERITRDVDVDKDFRKGFLGALDGAMAMGMHICQAIELDGSYSFLGLREREGKPHLLFRMLSDGALNYHELEVVRDKRDRVRVNDAFIYLSGEYYSATSRRVYVRAAAEQNRGILSSLMGEDSEFFESVDIIDRFHDLAGQGKFKEALAEYDKLPESVAKSRFMQQSRIVVAQEVSEEIYLATLEEYLTLFPKDAGLSLLMIDAHMYREEFAESLKAVDKLDRSVGGDPYLDCLRANILLASGEVDDAFAKARRACSSQPGLEDTWWTLVGMGLMAERWAAVAEGLEGLEANFEMELNDLATVEEFAGFAASEEGKAWIAKRAVIDEETDEG